MLDKAIETHLLYDFYGVLLTKRQRDTLELRLFDDWSLAEIADHLGISRQAVHDTVQRTLTQLSEYEQRLGLLAAHERRKQLAADIESRLCARDIRDSQVLKWLHDML